MWYVLLVMITTDMYRIESIHTSLAQCEQQAQAYSEETVCATARVRLEFEMGSS